MIIWTRALQPGNVVLDEEFKAHRGRRRVGTVRVAKRPVGSSTSVSGSRWPICDSDSAEGSSICRFSVCVSRIWPPIASPGFSSGMRASGSPSSPGTTNGSHGRPWTSPVWFREQWSSRYSFPPHPQAAYAPRVFEEPRGARLRLPRAGSARWRVQS